MCLLLAANAAFGATLPTCGTMSGSNELCGVIVGLLTVTNGPDPLKLSGSTLTAITGLENTAGTGYTSGWSVLGAPINPGSTANYTNVPLTLTTNSSLFTLACTPDASVTLNATPSGDSLNVTSCNLTLSGISVTSTLTSNINFAANTIPQALPLPFGSVAIGSGSSATYICNDVALCPGVTNVPTTLSISNGTISSTCVSCTALGLTPPTSTGLSFTAQQGAGAPPSQTVTVTDSPVAAVNYAVTTSTTSGGSWLSVSPTGGQIGSGSTTFQVSVSPGSLAPGTYSGSVTVYAADSNGTKTEPVTFIVTAASFSLVATPSSFTFTSINSAIPATQNLAVTTSTKTAVSFTAAASSTSGWLSVTPTTGTTGSTTISVKADPTKVSSPGTYTGTVTLTAAGATNSPLVLNVTFNVSTVTVAPTTLSFTASTGGSNPPSQQVNINATGPNVPYTASASTTSGGNWLSVSPTSGTTGSAVTVSANIAALAAGTYNGTISVTPSGGSAIIVPVSLTVTSLPTLVPTPSSLSFSSANGAVPGNQTLGIASSTSTNINYTVTANTTTGGSWLQVSPSSGVTPGSETVSISSTVLAGLATGTYTGSVQVTCSPTTSCGNASGLLTVPVTLTVTAALNPTPAAVTFNYTSGGSTPASQQIAVASTGGPITYTAVAATTTGGAWLSVSPASATTPAGVTASVNAGVLTGLAAGTYSGSITLTSTGATNSPVVIAVTLKVTSVPTLSVTGGPLTFNMVNLGSVPSAQNLSVSASNGSAQPFTTSVATSSGGSWLAASPSSGTTPGTVSVSILPNTLAAGTYSGTVSVSSTGVSNSPVVVNVNLVVGAAPTLSVSPGSLTYTYTLLSGTNPSSQTVSVTASGGAAIPFTAAASTTSGGNWLSVSPTSGTTPGSLTVSVNTAGLAAGNYSGKITVTSANASNSPQTVGVTFTVNAAPALISSSPSLTFAYQTGGSTPPPENISITSSGAALSLTAAVATSSGGNWLAVSPTSGTTPATLSVSVVPAVISTLAAGNYSGTVTITSAQAGNSPLIVNVTLTVSALPSLTAAPSALSFTYSMGGTVPGSQNVIVGTSGSSPISGVTATTTTPWLSVNENVSTTPVTLTVSLVSSALAGLSAGPHSGTITISGTGANSLTYPVTLTVSAQPVLSVAPSALTFNGQSAGSSPAPQSLSVTSTNGSVSFTAAAATSSGGSWLSVTPTSGATNTTVQVSVNTTGMASGTYTGTITITASGATGSPAVIPITLTLSANALTSTPSLLSFTYQLGGTAPSNQNLNVSSTVSGLTFTATSGATWLSVTPANGTTPQTLTVSIVIAGLTAQTYNTTITLTPSGTGNTPITVPVSLTVSSGPPLTAAPNALSFSYSVGGSTPLSQAVLIAAGSSAVGFTATAATTSGGNWLAVSPTSGTTPGSINVSLMNLSALTAGTYNGTVTAAATGSAPVVIPVTLTVSSTPSITLNPTNLSFSYTAGSTLPNPQSIAVSTSNAASAAFSATASTTTGGPWLQVSPTNGASPASLTVTLAANSLAAGTYTGTITVAASGFTSASVAVTLVVTQAKAVIQITGNTLFTLANTAPPATSTLTVSASDGSSQAFTIAIGATQNNWLTLSPASGTTPASIKLTANPAGLIPGIYVTPITVTMPGLPISTKTIEIQLTITGSNLVAAPNMLTFTYTPGAPLPPAQAISLTTASGTGTVPLASVTTDVPWLKVTPATSAPTTLQVSVSPGLLAAGTYVGDVIVKGVGSPAASLEIPVTITISPAPQLTVAPASLTFTYVAGGAIPAPQSFALATGNAQLAFTATSPGSWLQLTPLRGTTPGSVLVSANPVGLAAGTYSGNITVSAIGATNSVTLPVSLTVSGTSQLTVAPTSLTFTSPIGGPAPAAQTLTVSSASGALGFSAASSAAWLSVTPTTGTTPATLAVSVNPAGLAAGTYNGAISITQTGSASPELVLVTLQVGSGSTATIAGVINAASGVVGTVSPGMAISIFGSNLGPQSTASFALPSTGGTIATTLGGTQVLIDGIPVPVLYSSPGQVNALVPFELTNATTALQVEYNNSTSVGMTLPVVAAEPGIFTLDGTGKGQGSILNQDYSINSSAIPAAAGSAIMIFGTGGGVTTPASIDGALSPLPPPFGALVLPTTATVNGQPATVLYSGPAPNLISGVFQINVTIPSGTPSGDIPLVVSVGGFLSQTVTVAVQ
jgi:uncharacterized protein (TIGR03437 family)